MTTKTNIEAVNSGPEFDKSDLEWMEIYEQVKARVPNIFGGYKMLCGEYAREVIRIVDEARAASGYLGIHPNQSSPMTVEPAAFENKDEARLRTLERICAGVTDEMIEGGWTALGLSRHAKSLENKIAEQSPAPASPSGEDAAEQSAAPMAESHVVFITDRTQSIDDVLPQDHRWVISKAIGLVAGYRNCKESETKEAMQEFVDYMRSALADAALPRASEQADEAAKP